MEWDVDPGALNAEVPTLLLQPLVENAVKHGVSQLVEGGTVRIRVEAKGGDVVVSLDNPMDSDRETPKGLGMGLGQVRQRLQARFGAEGRMEVESKNGLHAVRLVFPLIVKEGRDD